MSDQPGFDQSKYWIDRHDRLQGDPRSVGNLARSVEENLAGEQELQGLVTQAGELLSPLTANKSVLDLGCGYGRIAPQWIGTGFAYTGVDISPVAVEAARERASQGRFLCADLLSWQPDEKYGVVSVLYVLVHFVDDTKWRRFLQNALAAIDEGGFFIFADHFPAKLERPAAHVAARPLSDYQAELASLGFALDADLQGRLIARSPVPAARHFQFARRARAGETS